MEKAPRRREKAKTYAFFQGNTNVARNNTYVRQIIRVFAKEGATLKDLGTATMSVICFAGLFRSKERYCVILHYMMTTLRSIFRIARQINI